MSKNNKIKVKLSPESFQKSLTEQYGSLLDGYDNCEFHCDSNFNDCDYWIVLHDFKYHGHAYCPQDNTIFVTGEPVTVKKYSRKFLKQFATVITAQENLPHPHVIKTHQALTWGFHKTYDELNRMKPFEKSKFMSIVSSNKRFSKGHEQRYQFVLDIKRHFGNKLDLYGRGISEFNDKWDVLAPYMYSIAIENSSSQNYITEKLTECFLSYTFPLYSGCPNVDDYYPKGSFEWIDMSDRDGSIDLIEKILNEPTYYQKHFRALCEARRLYLEQYDYYPLLTHIINSLNQQDISKTKKTIYLSPAKPTLSDVIFKFKCLDGMFKNAIDNHFKK